jgi:glutaredoxin-like protein NrdH
MSDRQIKLFALSTCGWCRKTVSWLNEHGVQYELFHVDQASSSEKEQFMSELSKHNPRKSFPTLVVGDGDHVIIGYRPDEMKEELL